jgi:hypothetical protein
MNTSTVLVRAAAGTAAVLLPFATLVVVYLLIAELTTRTQSPDRTLDLGGYALFAGAAVAICGMVGVAGSALSRFESAARIGIAVGWLIVGASAFLLAVTSFIPAAPPWASWNWFRTFIGLIGTPLVVAVAMTNYAVGFAVRRPGRRRLAITVLSIAPGLMIVLCGLLDPLS